MEQFVLSPIPLEDLKAAISIIVRSELATKRNSDAQERLLSPIETCKVFEPAVSKVTLHKWTEEGRIQCHRIGGRIYYKFSEIIGSLTTLKRYSRAF